jgi:DNA-binding FadR family transcriptional regulator
MGRVPLAKQSLPAAVAAFTRDPGSHGTLQRQVYDFLRRAIVHGDLPPGSHLPSTRALSRRWGVSRNIVLTAYEELAIEGLVLARVGSGTRVRGRAPVVRLPDPRVLLRESHYPARAVTLRDPDGNPLYLH